VATTKKVLLSIGSAAGVVAIVIGVGGVGAISSAAEPVPDPSLPTLFTNPQTQIVNGDGSRVDCIAIDQALSCPGYSDRGADGR